ncbi:MAG: hypothetical protein U0324_31645 [Polyangiales bacterium]
MARRHLPVLNAPAPAPKAAPAPDANADGSADEPPPWHWVPLGTVVSVVAFALLAQGAASLATRVLARVYPPGSTATQLAAIRAARGAAAVATELVAGMVPLAALLAAVALGGFVVGRYGERTNDRHGALSGLCTGVVFWAVTGRLGAMLAVVPFAGAAGWAAARAGLAVRARGATSSTSG